MVLNDNILRGFLAGLSGGVAMNIINLASYHAGVAELRYLDWAALVIYGTNPQNSAEVAFALFAQLVFVGFLGSVFAYIITMIGSGNHLFRGALYGTVTWFLVYGISLLYKVEGTIPLHVDTAATDFFGALIYGLVLAETLRRLDEKVEL